MGRPPSTVDERAALPDGGAARFRFEGGRRTLSSPRAAGAAARARASFRFGEPRAGACCRGGLGRRGVALGETAVRACRFCCGRCVGRPCGVAGGNSGTCPDPRDVSGRRSFPVSGELPRRTSSPGSCAPPREPSEGIAPPRDDGPDRPCGRRDRAGTHQRRPATMSAGVVHPPRGSATVSNRATRGATVGSRRRECGRTVNLGDRNRVQRDTYLSRASAHWTSPMASVMDETGLA
jgi:hypothetical protein